METRFFSADSFTGAGVNGWDVSNLVDMSYAFYNAVAFNGDLSLWDVSQVTDFHSTVSGFVVFLVQEQVISISPVCHLLVPRNKLQPGMIE